MLPSCAFIVDGVFHPLARNMRRASPGSTIIATAACACRSAPRLAQLGSGSLCRVVCTLAATPLSSSINDTNSSSTLCSAFGSTCASSPPKKLSTSHSSAVFLSNSVAATKSAVKHLTISCGP